ncbi:hypothetical protein EVAR_13457_1 [Eumeta japonica]|uniref:Uncharacterized protein n=1 Tax=Eumeta variegata TaxID=151549 RepID=A0A4C1UXZ9_EUMVA|nr:hypothetical protein EVAR_13457_1 [Eumeta japonica]
MRAPKPVHPVIRGPQTVDAGSLLSSKIAARLRTINNRPRCFENVRKHNLKKKRIGRERYRNVEIKQDYINIPYIQAVSHVEKIERVTARTEQSYYANSNDVDPELSQPRTPF